MALSQKWKKTIIALSLLLTGVFFGYLVSLLEGSICLIAIAAGMLIGLIFDQKRAWWFIAGVCLGGLPIMILRGAILCAVEAIQPWQIALFAISNPLLVLLGSYLGHWLKKKPTKKSSQP